MKVIRDVTWWAWLVVVPLMVGAVAIGALVTMAIGIVTLILHTPATVGEIFGWLLIAVILWAFGVVIIGANRIKVAIAKRNT